ERPGEVARRRDGTHLDRHAILEKRALLRDRGGRVEAVDRDQQVATDELLRLGEWAVDRARTPLRGHHAPRILQRMPVLELPLRRELVAPVVPALHRLPAL